MPRFAERTTVPVGTTKGALEAMLRQHGATAVGTMWGDGESIVVFRMGPRMYRISLPMPTEEDLPKRYAGRSLDERIQQCERQRWRALLLVVKAKLTAVEEGITDMETAFLAELVLPTGQTVREATRDHIDLSYHGKKGVPLISDAA